MAENIGSLAVSLSLDASNFNGSLSSVDRSLKTMGSELKAVKAKGADYGRSLDGLSKKQDILKRSLDTSNVKLTETRKKYDEMVSSGKATEAQLERQAKKVNDAQAEYNKLQTELGQVEADLRSLSSTLGKQEEAWTKLSKKVDAAADKMQVSGEKMRSIGRNMTTYMTTPLVAMGVAAAKTGMDFEAQMSRVGAISQATGKELGQLNKQALELGASTSKSASEVALGMENLAAMGFEVNEIIGAMPGVIAAAEASGEDMALTADVMAAAINAFGLEASDASHVADVLAQAANQSAADINDMGYAFKYAAPVAKMLGISLEELAAATGIMTDSGLAGEQAGTALRSALLRLSDPPKAAANELKRLGINITDASGNMLPFSNIIGQLGKKTDGMANAQKAAALSTIFGTEAVSGMLAVIEAGPEKLDKLTKGLENSGGASEETAKKMKDNLKGALEELGGTIETAAITVAKILTPSIKKASDTIQGLVEKFQDLTPEAQKTIITIGGIAAAAGPTLMVLGSMTTGIGGVLKVVAPLLPMLGAGGGLAGILTALTGPIGLTVAGVGLLAGGILAVKHATEEANEVNLEHAESLITQQGELSILSDRYNELADKNRLTNDELLKYMDTQTKLQNETDPSKIENLSAVMKLLQERSGLTNEEISEMLELNGQIIKTAPEINKAYSDRGNAIVANKDALDEVNDRLRESIRLELENQQIKAEANLNQNIQDYVKALNELNEAEAARNAVKAERDAKEVEVLDLKLQKEKAIREGNEAGIVIAENELMLQQGNLNGLNQELSTLADVVAEKQNSVAKSQEEIDKVQQLYAEMINIELAQAGINTMGAEGIVQLDQSIAKTQGRLQTLFQIGKSQGGLNQQQQEEYDLLSQQLGVQQESRTAIQGMQKDQAGVNKKIDEGTGKAKELTKEADKDVHKDVNVDDQGKAKKITAESEKGVRKNVNVDDNGKAKQISNEAGRSMTKRVTLSAAWTGIKAGLRAALPNFFAAGTKNAPSGLAVVGEAGRELMSIGKGLYLANGPNLVNLPKGAKVIPNRDTEAILRKWNVPAYANGTDNAIGGMSLVGERGRELVSVGNNESSKVTNLLDKQNQILLQLLHKNQHLYVDGQKLADITNNQNAISNALSYF